MMQHKKICECCAREFICTPEDIARCDCSRIELSDAQRRYIANKYKDCMCSSCLQKLKSEFNALYENK